MAADLEKALLQTHKDLIDAIFHRGNDPRNKLPDLMSPKLHGCGTARHETIQSIDDYLSIFDGEINELPVGLMDRPVNLRTTIIENVGIVHGAYELIFEIENQNTSMYVRLTVVYEHRNKKWQAIHLHGSEPSAHIAEGETWPVEALKAQNEELQKTVTEKTADLEQKNNDLLIEVALEKVRSRTMAMHNSSELAETTEVLHQQLLDLGIHADRTTIVFPDETSGAAEFWSTNQGGIKIEYQFKADLAEPHHAVKTLAGWKQKLKSMVIHLEGEVLTALLEYYSGKVGLPFSGQLSAITARDYTSAYFSHGWITLVTTEPLSKEKINILERFAAVFNLTYTRFLDLQKAEAQAREAKIETSLEKVRSRSMAMHHSGDLHEVLKVVAQQLTGLGLKFDGAHFSIVNPEGSWDLWVSTPEQSYPAQIHLPYLDHRIFNRTNEIIASGVDFFTDIYNHKEKNSFFTHFFKNTTTQNIPEARKQFVLNSKGFARSVFLMQNIWLSVGNYEAIPYTDEENALLKRFANVFKQSYTRFLDLQKAEAQAREAKIEASLERVRSKAMSMHSSRDLADTISLFYHELELFSITPRRCGIGLLDRETQIAELSTMNTTEQGNSIEIIGKLKMADHPVLQGIFDHWILQKEYHPVLRGNEIKDYYQLVRPQIEFPDYPHDEEQFGYFFFFTEGGVYAWTDKELGENELKIYRRFTTVLSLTYKRYKDIKEAEAQAREAKIEASLERVRTGAMAMHKSEELGNVASLMFDQIRLFEGELWACGVVLCDKNKRDTTQWMSAPGIGMLPPNNVPHDLEVYQQHMFDAWKEGNELFMEEVGGEEIKKHYQVLSTIPSLKESFQKIIESGTSLPTWQKNHAASFKNGYLLIITTKPFEEVNLFSRFAKVFEQAYTRFLDLQKAEAQAREAQIELGLERVRARAMAMQNSEELKELISTVFAELTKLDLVLTRCLIMIYDPKTNGSTWWMANSEAPSDSIGLFVQYHEQPPYLAYIKAWQQRNLKWQYILEGTVKKQWDDFLFYETELSHLPDFVIAGMKAPGSVYLNASFNNFGNLTLASLEPLSNEHFDILLRFAKVFDLTYTRFNDLKQAEAQAKEAQIELGLERVRARAMAMQKSEEFLELIEKIYSELQNLGFNALNADLMIFTEDKKGYDIWVSGAYGAEGPYRIPEAFFNHPHHLGTMNSWIKGDQLRITELNGDKFTSFFKLVLDDTFGLQTLSGQSKDKIFALGQIIHTEVFTKHGCIRVGSIESRTEGQLTIQKRFAQVFDQTYTRFLDLKKAEAQAREATIEAALERVRSRTMAMHNSQDVGDTAIVIFDELEKLGVATNRCGIIKFEDKGYMEVWTAGLGVNFAIRGRLDTRIHRMLAQGYRAWKNKEATFSYFLQGSDLTDYYTALSNAPEYPYQMPDTPPSAQAISLFFFPEGALYAFTPETLSNEALQVFSRFAAVFALTYRRYLDLMIAEQQTRQALQQSSLDRVRAEIASMRTTADLENITPLIWNELTTLGVPFIRCGVFIMDEDNKQIQTFLSTPDGKAIAAFKLPFTTPGIPAQALAHWRKKEILTDHWDEAAFKKWTANLVEQGVITSTEKYSPEHSPASLHLYFLPFLQGMLYVGSEVPLGDDDIYIAQTLANAFSTAYSRFEDFNKLESAKQQIEKTLVDLKLAQSQLVQSEKMASLGELTAGIAHEIQNPLNFVNNFSEVSMELIEEVKSEKLKAKSERNEELENELLDDITENLQKISHHGKRADFIVKGMLQHSRTSTGEKQATNINTLADEFLKLSYHGLRAKDKSFNAELITNFDKSLPQISVVQQDIGRVLLNLFNNAFYAVNERTKNKEQGLKTTEYKPTVEVSTSIKDGFLVITVKDNGIGIPEAIKEKIMQPFFTTKPTGEGTGLGLSLSYDIVKAHGGEIKAESKQGEGSIFTVQLPS